MNEALLEGGRFDGETVPLKYFSPRIKKQVPVDNTLADAACGTRADNPRNQSEFVEYIRTDSYKNGKRIYVPEGTKIS